MPKRVTTYRPPASNVPTAVMPSASPPPRDNTAWRRFINSPQWRRCAKSYLRRHAYCVQCWARGELVAASIVHHTIANSFEHAFDEDTLEALCSSCHSHHHAAESREAKDQRRERNDEDDKHDIMYV
jgi:5-methylcytosine-specific restriction endonuclease McrA